MNTSTAVRRDKAISALKSDIKGVASEVGSRSLKDRVGRALKGTSDDALAGMQGLYDCLKHGANAVSRDIWTRSDRYIDGVMAGMELDQASVPPEKLRKLQEGLDTLLTAVRAGDEAELESRYS